MSFQSNSRYGFLLVCTKMSHYFCYKMKLCRHDRIIVSQTMICVFAKRYPMKLKHKFIDGTILIVTVLFTRFADV